MEALPLQVDTAGKQAEDLMKLHKDGNPPGEEGAQIADQDLQPEDFQKQLTALQAKYDVLDGKYKKEIENADLKDLQRLENENVVLKRQVTQLEGAMQANEDLVKEVREELDKNKAAPAAKAPELDVTAILSDEERAHLESEDLGGKTLEIFLKMARAAGGTQLENQLQKISTQVEDLSKRTESTEKVQHQVTIDTAVPEFKEVNDEPEFHTWLDKSVNSFSTRTNRDELQEALNTGNFKSVKDGIKAFKDETGWGADPGKKSKKEKTLPIEPDESFTGDDTTVKEGKIYTMVQVKKFYEDQTKGKWVGREKEAAAIDRDITLAQTEGRIKP